MNKFDRYFFSKYAPEGEEISHVFHRHPLAIADDVAVWLFFGALLPTLFYVHDSFGLASLVPLPYFEGFLALVWAGLMWRVFDWHNDVWILTDKSIVDLDWTPTKQQTSTMALEHVEGVESRETTLADNLLGRGDVEIHSIGNTLKLEGAWQPGKIVSAVREASETARGRGGGGYSPEPFPDMAPEHGQAGIPGPDTEFGMLLDALKDLVRERIDEKRVKREEREAVRPALEAALAKPGTIDLRPDHEKWEREPAWSPNFAAPAAFAADAAPSLPEWAAPPPDAHAEEPLPEPPPEERAPSDDQTSFPA